MRADKLLVLDLDETLIHASIETPAGDNLVPVAFEVGPYDVRLRPFVGEFVEFCFATFADVGVWTSATRAYADEVVPGLFGARAAELAFCFSRERCTRRFDALIFDDYYVKNLAKLKRRWPLEQVIMVDNTPRKLERQYGNLVRVRDFEGAADDDELRALQCYLGDLAVVPNVRRVEKRGWRARYS